MDDLAPSVSMAEAALLRLSTASGRESLGTAAGLRRALVRLPEPMRANLSTQYAGLYRAALSESLLLFLHLSKSGGTALCELAKLNGCWRAGAGDSSLSSNCANKYNLADGPRWLPPRSIQAIVDFGLRRFAVKNFHSPPREHFARGCGARGRRGRHGAETFRAVEGSAPEARRCPGTVEALMLREPMARLGSFGRELTKWGLLPEPVRRQIGPLCTGLRRHDCQAANRVRSAVLAAPPPSPPWADLTAGYSPPATCYGTGGQARGLLQLFAAALAGARRLRQPAGAHACNLSSARLQPCQRTRAVLSQLTAARARARARSRGRVDV